MEIKKLICDVCGGQIELQSGGKGMCSSCGTSYSADIIKDKIQEIRGIVKIEGPAEIIKGEAEICRVLKDVENLISCKQYEKAMISIFKLLETFPNCLKGYIYYLQIISLCGKYLYRFSGEYKFSIDCDGVLKAIDNVYRTIADMNPDELSKPNEYINDFCKKIRSGSLVIVGPPMNAENYKNTEIIDIVKEGTSNAEKMNYIKRKKDINQYLFCIGKSVCINTYGDFTNQDDGSYFKFANDLDGAVRRECEKRKAERICVYCAGHFKGFINKVCISCGKPKNY